MAEIAAMIDWENEPVSMVAERAARRAIEAISRVGTLNTDLDAVSARVAALEALCGDLIATILIIEERGR